MHLDTPHQGLALANELVAEGRSTFTFEEVEKRLGKSKTATANLLKRMEKAGLIDRVRRGHYVVRQLGVLGTPAAAESIALAVGAALKGMSHRIAYRSALYEHDLVTHPARSIQVAAERRVRTKTLSGRPLRVVIESPEMLDVGCVPWGTSYVSDLHRAVLDAAQRPRLVGGLEVLAEAFSAAAHEGQFRKNGDPFVTHCVEVARILAELQLDSVTVAAGLIHDVVEDTLTTIEKIQEHFGPEVAHVVEGVTKISAIPFSSSEERQAENFRKMLLAMVDDIRVILVKLADRLHNMRTLQHMADDQRIRIAQETLDIYAPIANRLGMSRIKNELEELSFKYIEPAAYESLRNRVEAKRRPTQGMIEQLAADIRSKLSEAQVPVISIDGRVKRLYSIWLKLKAQKIDLEQVYDFVALRVVTPSVKDCYAALGIIHQTWSPVPGRIKDFIAMPRPNGYQSLHTSVISDHGFPLEVQIRTEEMHRRAEEGIAAHWKYKEGRVGDHHDERYFQWMRQLLEVQQEVRDPQEFLQNLKIDLYPQEVYIFTPKGDVRSLPRAGDSGSTRHGAAAAVFRLSSRRAGAGAARGRAKPDRTAPDVDHGTAREPGVRRAQRRLPAAVRQFAQPHRARAEVPPAGGHRRRALPADARRRHRQTELRVLFEAIFHAAVY